MSGLLHPLVHVEGLSRAFDVSPPWLDRMIARAPRRRLQAVDEVTFSVQRGETFGLVGESGSGKSTVARLIAGLVTADAGRILLDGTQLPPLDHAAGRVSRRRLTMIFQDPYGSLNPRMAAAAIIAEPVRMFSPGMSTRDVDVRVAELLTQVQLSSRDGAKYPHEFSGGQRQRIAIARALASEPEFIICDEPTSALDVSVQAQVLNLMRDLQDRLGIAYLFISHNLAVVRHMASEVGVMYLGRLVEVAPARDIFSHPRHPYTRMLLDAVPSLSSAGRPGNVATGEIANALSPPPGCPFHPRCPLATQRCREERPQMRALGQGRVACHVAVA